MKKKNSLEDKLFKIIMAIAVVTFLVIFFTKQSSNIHYEKNSFMKKETMKDTPPLPSQLKWHDSFKGISNEGKKEKEGMNYFK